MLSYLIYEVSLIFIKTRNGLKENKYTNNDIFQNYCWLKICL